MAARNFQIPAVTREQFHKGGPNTGLFLQPIDESTEDLEVLGTDYTVGTLIKAQALRIYYAFKKRGR